MTIPNHNLFDRYWRTIALAGWSKIGWSKIFCDVFLTIFKLILCIIVLSLFVFWSIFWKRDGEQILYSLYVVEHILDDGGQVLDFLTLNTKNRQKECQIRAQKPRKPKSQASDGKKECQIHIQWPRKPKSPKIASRKHRWTHKNAFWELTFSNNSDHKNISARSLGKVLARNWDLAWTHKKHHGKN